MTGSQNVDEWPNAQQLPPLEPATLTEIPQDSQENQTTRDPENLQLAELRSRTKLTYSDISDTESANVNKKRSSTLSTTAARALRTEQDPLCNSQ